MICIKASNVNPAKLVTELTDTGLVVLNSTWDAIDDITQIVNEISLFFNDDTDITAAQTVIDAHSPEPSPQKPTLEERNRADIDYLSIMTGVDLDV